MKITKPITGSGLVGNALHINNKMYKQTQKCNYTNFKLLAYLFPNGYPILP